MLVSSLLFVFSLIIWSYMVSTFCDIKASYAPLISISTFMGLGILAGMLNILSVGIGLIYAVTFLFGVFLIYKRRREFCKYIFQLPIVCLLVSCVCMGILFSIKTPFFIAWDEFSHWGPFLKNLKYTNALHIFSNRYFVHQTYVQGMPILYYISSYFDSTYREAGVYLAYSILLHTCSITLIPCTPINKSWKSSCLYILLVPFLMYLFPYASYAAPYTCSYLDAVIGALFGGIMVFIINNSQENLWCKKKVWCLAALLFTLLQIKDISIAFYLICLATCTINLIYQVHKGNLASSIHKLRFYIIHILFAVIVPLSGKLLWNLLLKLTQKDVDQFSDSTLSKALELLQSFVKGENDYFGQVSSAFWYGIKNVNISWTRTSIPVVIFALLAFSCLIAYKYYRLEDNRVVGVHLGLFAGYFLCYLAVLFVIYLCGMSPEEAATNASMDRYIASFIAGWSMLLFGLFFKLLVQSNHSMTKGIVLIAILYIYITMPLNNVDYWIRTKEQTGLAWHEEKSQECIDIAGDKANIWLIITGNEDWHRKYIFSYMLMPNNVSLTLPVDDTNYTTDEILELAKANHIDYLWVVDSNQSFGEKYLEYITIKNDANDGRCMLMRVTETGTLEQVY